AAHIWRAIAEGFSLARSPVFYITTLAAAALALWAWRVVRTLSQREARSGV
ncbi:MAG: hypothetical protein QOK23_4429, partial [Gammaproteobacteria bacterium]|nr:hypothetical protein [Gammaproteobacteria bacterium]